MAKKTLKQMKQLLLENGIDTKGLDKEDIRQEYELLMTQILADEMLGAPETEATVISAEVTSVASQEQAGEVTATEETEIPAQEQTKVLNVNVTPAAEQPVTEEAQLEPVAETKVLDVKVTQTEQPETTATQSEPVIPEPKAEQNDAPPTPQQPATEIIHPNAPAQQPTQEQTQQPVERKIAAPKCEEDVLEYIIWKQLTAEKLYVKHYLNESRFVDYCKQKITGRMAVDFATKQPAVFTEEELQQVQDTINALIKKGFVKRVQGENKFFESFNGYVISPAYFSYICNRGYKLKDDTQKRYEDVVYRCEEKRGGVKVEVEYQLDYSSKCCAIRKTGKIFKLADTFEDEYKKPKTYFEHLYGGKFVGVVNQRTKEFTEFKAPVADTPVVNEPTVPASEPVVPAQGPVVPQQQ